MKFAKVTLASALEMAGEKEIYILTELSGDTTLADFKKAAAYVVRIEDDEQIPEPEPAEAPEEPARRKSSIDHDRIMELAAAGYPPKEIAEQIGCSEQTVRNHIARENPR